MYITSINVKNYRNIEDCLISFSYPSTFIVGENNLGKTNLLKLLQCVFNRTMLSEDDFADPDTEVSLLIKLILEDYEIGFFNDFADSSNYRQLSIRASVDDPSSEFHFFHDESGEEISGALVRRVCYFLFESLNADSRTLDYSKDRGVGRVLTRSLTKYQEVSGLETLDFFDEGKLRNLISYLNTMLGKLSILSGYGVHAGIASSETGALGSIVTLTEANNLHFRHASSGVQYVALTVMQILEALMKLSKRKLEQCVFQDDDGRKSLSVIIAFDEPEVHLHPYMQRTLTKYLESIACGRDENFNSLLKEFFGVDAISAQLIVVTHSPSIVPHDYKKIVRFHSDAQSKLTASIGSGISMTDSEETRLVALFDTVKEAFFSRAAIVVEGESEVMSFPGFAESLGCDLDANGIIVVNAHGKESVPAAYRLLKKFGLPVWSIVDRDKKNAVLSGGERTTEQQDFEAEVIESMFASGHQDVFIDLLEQCEQSLGRRKVIPGSQLAKYAGRYLSNQLAGQEFSDTDFTGKRFDGVFSDDPFTRLMMYSWMSNQKGVLFGKLLGLQLPLASIPTCYLNLIKDVVR